MFVLFFVLVFTAAAPPNKAPDESAPSDTGATSSATLIAQIDELIGKLEYEEARELILIALATSDLTREQHFHMQLQAGIVQRIVDRDVEARMHFTEALLIDPNAKLPVSVAPKIRTFFKMVKRDFERSKQASKDVEGLSNDKEPVEGKELEEPSLEQSKLPPDDIKPPSFTGAFATAGVIFGIIAPVAMGTGILSYFALVNQSALSPATREMGRVGWVGGVFVGAISGLIALGLGGTATLLWVGEIE